MKKFLTLLLAFFMLFTVNVGAAIDVKSVSACLTTDKKSVQSKYYWIDANNMFCEVMSKSKYPIKFQAYGSVSETSTGKVYKTATYNVNSTGTVPLPSGKYNCSSIKLSGNDVGTVKKGCIGWGKIY